VANQVSKIFKKDEFTNAKWLAKNLPSGDIASWIVVSQDVSIAMAVCNDAAVVPLFDTTNLRIFNAL